MEFGAGPVWERGGGGLAPRRCKPVGGGLVTRARAGANLPRGC